MTGAAPRVEPSRGLVELSIRGVGVIDAAEWEWGPGLTVITGETGSGKTMVLTGLSLILGGSSDTGLVRAGHDTAVVEGRFQVDDPVVAHQADEGTGAREVVELLAVDRCERLGTPGLLEVLHRGGGRLAGIVPSLERRDHHGTAGTAGALRSGGPAPLQRHGCHGTGRSGRSHRAAAVPCGP